jgi:hypothetical protein
MFENRAGKIKLSEVAEMIKENNLALKEFSTEPIVEERLPEENSKWKKMKNLYPESKGKFFGLN